MMRLTVVVSFLNEAAFLPRFLASIERQTRLPNRLVLVDDGSSDGSGELAAAFAARHEFAVALRRPPRPPETDRLAGAAELRSFEWAVAQLDGGYDVLAKLDADLALNPRHIEHVLEEMEADPRLGLAGAILADVLPDGSAARQPAPQQHVRGATKFYRRECYEQIQPIPPHLGWDMIDEVRARRAGWRTESFELPGGDTLHLRPTGRQDGRLRAYRRWGECAWGYGAHPAFVLLGAVMRLSWRPYVAGGVLYGFGYASAAACRLPRVEREVRVFVWREELRQARARLRLVLARGIRMRRPPLLRKGIRPGPRDEPPVVHLACSAGGHLDLMLRLRGVFADRRVVWVTQHSARAKALRRAEAEVHILGEYSRSLLRQSRAQAVLSALRMIWYSARLLARDRPGLVVTTGSGITVPFCLLARMTGARVVFVETAARVCGPSNSGRVLSRIAHRVIVQWEGMCSVYRDAVLARSSVVEGLSPQRADRGEGTFVGVGTHTQPFDRLLRVVDRAATAGTLAGPLVVQTGPSAQPVHGADLSTVLAPETMSEHVRSARYVVCHAGTGTIATALRAGRRPLVLPRLERHGEHYDDHQQQIVDKLAALDLVVRLDGEITVDDLTRADRPLQVPSELEVLPRLADCLREQVRQLAAAP
jgi:UDP-N-acetylglucosamine transferase subunit ALG13